MDPNKDLPIDDYVGRIRSTIRNNYGGIFKWSIIGVLIGGLILGANCDKSVEPREPQKNIESTIKD
tara:strand:- start:302 stop:499 length:198 start_codon:yes stop_codon:yes gene_type:complete